MSALKGNILKKENGDWNFKDIFLETLDQDRYGIARRNDDNDSKERGISNTAKNNSSEEKRVTVTLPNIQTTNGNTERKKIHQLAKLDVETAERQAYQPTAARQNYKLTTSHPD